MAHQRLAAPVLADEGEHLVLDAVPFAGAGRQIHNCDADASFVDEASEFALPRARAGVMAVTVIRGKGQGFGLRIMKLAQATRATDNRKSLRYPRRRRG